MFKEVVIKKAAPTYDAKGNKHNTTKKQNRDAVAKRVGNCETRVESQFSLIS